MEIIRVKGNRAAIFFQKFGKDSIYVIPLLPAVRYMKCYLKQIKH